MREVMWHHLLRVRVWGCSIPGMNKNKVAKRKYKFASYHEGDDALVMDRHGVLEHTHFEGFRSRKEKFTPDDVASVSIESGGAYVERVSGGRMVGGAIAGTVLLGPLGTLLGGGVGALARKGDGGEQFLIVTLTDGRVLSLAVPRKKVGKASAMRDSVADAITPR